MDGVVASGDDANVEDEESDSEVDKDLSWDASTAKVKLHRMSAAFGHSIS